MAIGNVAKNFKWVLEIDGLNQFLAQEVQIPVSELSLIEVGAGVNEPNKQLPGKAKLGTLTLKKLVDTVNTEVWAYDWLEKAKTQNREVYAKFAFLKLLADDGETVVRTYDCGEIFPFKISPENLTRKGTDAFVETVEFAVSRFKALT